jgi:hypothetical protein
VAMRVVKTINNKMCRQALVQPNDIQYIMNIWAVLCDQQAPPLMGMIWPVM